MPICVSVGHRPTYVWVVERLNGGLGKATQIVAVYIYEREAVKHVVADPSTMFTRVEVQPFFKGVGDS